MRILRATFALLLLASSLSACGAAIDQLGMANVQGCVQKNCSDADAKAYQQCEASCRKTYGQ